MNLILFEEPFESVRLEGSDPKAQHLRKVLRAKVGTLIFIGFVNGLRARAEVTSAEPDGSFELKVVATEPAPGLLPIHLLIGLPRPHTARRILQEASSMGVGGLHFFPAANSEPSYANSRLWQTDEWRQRILSGVEQGFGTQLPEVILHTDVHAAIEASAKGAARIALDNYEADSAFGKALGYANAGARVAIAIGPERGWSADEREIFRKNKWTLVHLGPHVLRVETACVAAITATATQLGLWQNQTETVLQTDCVKDSG